MKYGGAKQVLFIVISYHLLPSLSHIMVDQVVCTCNKCSKHTYIASNGRRGIGRLISRRAKRDHLSDHLMQQAQNKKETQRLSSQDKARPVKPDSQHRPPKKHTDTPKIVIPNLNTGVQQLVLLHKVLITIDFQ